ncbi:MAG: hypothetical protein SFY56_06030 [Bacteroidota bacterium]|nr:hypothetical protein [Bacteroidota bacterium]
MKKIIFLFLLLPFFNSAQLEIKNQPSGDWFAATRQMHLKKFIKGDSLLKMKPTPFPAGFQDTLRAYDWVELGLYLYVDKKVSVWYNDEPLHYNIWRLATGDTVINFSCHGTTKKVTHTNFKDTYWMLPTYTYKKIGPTETIEACYMKTTKEYHRLISYKNGILVMDLPMNGKLTDKKMFSRSVYMARKKEFTWTKAENK